MTHSRQSKFQVPYCSVRSEAGKVVKLARILVTLLLGWGILTLDSALAQKKFRVDDPIEADPDQLAITLPEEIKLSHIYDFLENNFSRRPKKNEQIPRTRNINTLGEVPDSSWFTNRMGKQVMTVPELVRGPNRNEGPNRSRSWVIVGVKVQGVTPGFTIRDASDDIYFIKFDPPRHPQLTTATEVIGTKFFHAFGYNVPENHLSLLSRGDLTISPDARLEDEEGKERKVRDSDIDRVFRRAYQLPDGRTPVVASRRLPGIPLGPFKYFGTRDDDSNDIFAHQNRRELRGLRVFCAWLNHDDSRSVNSLDMYVGKPGEGYIEHYLIDFGSCLGSGSTQVQSRRAGNEYIFEWAPGLKSAFTLGIWDRPWRHVKYPDYTAIGRFEGDFFEPNLWRPEYPNPAFERMQIEDSFWATRVVTRFTNEMIRAIVQTGQISDPQAEGYLVETLIKRRDKIVGYYLSQINPLDDFRLASQGNTVELEFRNLGTLAGLGSDTSYQYQWFRFKNDTQSEERIGELHSSPFLSVAVPKTNGDYLMVRISTIDPCQPAWKNDVKVFIRNHSEKPAVVGIERESPQD